MECVLRRKGKKVLLSQKKGIGYEDLIEWEDAECFFEDWKNAMNEGGPIADFSYVEGGTLHIEWFESDAYSDDDVWNCTIKLDESNLQDRELITILEGLTKLYSERKDECQKSYIEMLEKIRLNDEMEPKALEIISDYAKCWSLPYTKDTRRFQEIATWISEHPKAVSRSGEQFCTNIEKVILKFMSCIALCSVFIGMLAFYDGILSSSINLYPLLFALGLGWAVIEFRGLYLNVCNERTVIDFLEDVEDDKVEKMEKFKKSIKEKLKDSNDKAKNYIKDDIEFMNEHSESDFAESRIRLEGVLSKLDNLDSLADRFKILEENLDIEEDIYGRNKKIGLKSEVEKTFRRDYLASRLSLIMYYDERLNGDMFMKSIDSMVNKLRSEPFYGVEMEIVRLTKLAVAYMKLCIRYNGLVELVNSSEYEALVKRGAMLMETINKKREASLRYGKLVEARENLDVVMGDCGELYIKGISVNDNEPLGRRIAFIPNGK